MISIIVPLYNTIKYLPKCVDSIYSQSYTDWECIVYDDCSTDGSFEYFKNLKDSRFKLFKNDTNLGCGLTRRKAISKGSGDWFAFLDSDDYFEKNFLRDMLDACLRTNSEIAICGTYHRDADYSYLRQDLAEKEYLVSKDELYKQYMQSSWILQYNGNKLYSRRVIDSVEYSGLRYCEDSTTTYKWLWSANQAVVVPKSYYNYIHHFDSNSNNNNTPLQKSIDTCKCVYDHFLFCKKNHFDFMIPSLKSFVYSHVVKCILNLETESCDYKFIDKIRNELNLSNLSYE